MGLVPTAFRVGGACAGFGECVNSTLTPGLRLCKCAKGYSGASDFFDNRVERLPDGTWLSYSCNESEIGTYVVWSLFCLLGVVRVFKIAPLWIQFVKRHYADGRKRAEGVWNDTALRIITFDLFTVTICQFTTGFCKLGKMTFGTDPLPTITLCLSTSFFQLVLFDLTRTEFNIFIESTANQVEAERAKRFRTTWKIVGVTLSFLFITVPSFWSLSTDKTKGPLINGNAEELVIFFRNVGAVIWSFAEIVTTWLVRKRVAALLAFSQDGCSTVPYAITKMDNELKFLVIFMAFVTLTYGTFVIPHLWAYQTYLIAFVVGLGSLRNTSGAFANEKEAKAHGVNLANASAKIRSQNSKSNSNRGKGSQIETPVSISPRNQLQQQSIPFDDRISLPVLSEASTDTNENQVEVVELLPITLQSSASAPSCARVSFSSKKDFVE